MACPRSHPPGWALGSRPGQAIRRRHCESRAAISKNGFARQEANHGTLAAVARRDARVYDNHGAVCTTRAAYQLATDDRWWRRLCAWSVVQRIDLLEQEHLSEPARAAFLTTWRCLGLWLAMPRAGSSRQVLSTFHETQRACLRLQLAHCGTPAPLFVSCYRQGNGLINMPYKMMKFLELGHAPSLA